MSKKFLELFSLLAFLLLLFCFYGEWKRENFISFGSGVYDVYVYDDEEGDSQRKKVEDIQRWAMG